MCSLLHVISTSVKLLLKKKKKKDFSGGLVVETLLPMQRAWVQSVVGEQRSHMPCIVQPKHTNPHTQKTNPPANKRAFGLADQSSSQVLGRSFHREVGLAAVNNRLKRKEREKKKVPRFQDTSLLPA